MATTSRQTSLFGVEDWKRIYKTYNEADFQSYNMETLRKVFIDYLRQHHPETFNDYTENSEYIRLLDMMAFLGQALSFRGDFNSRENFLDTAERRDSVTKLTKLNSYVPKRNESAHGYLKVMAISTTENLMDYNHNQLSNMTIKWNDRTNEDWQEQFTTILNAVLVNSQRVGEPGRTATIVGIETSEYQLNMAPGYLPVVPFNATVDGVRMNFEVVSATSEGENYIYEPAPRPSSQMNILYRNDNLGFASSRTGYFFYFKQGLLKSQDFTLTDRIANRSVNIDILGINNNDIWLYATTGNQTQWTQVDNIYSATTSQLEVDEHTFFSVTTRVDDQVALNFGDGVFSTIPVGTFRCFARSSNGLEYVINPNEIQNVDVAVNYISRSGRIETATFTLALTVTVSNAVSREQNADIKQRAPARFYTQNRMVNGEDYNNFPYANYSSIIKSKAINRSSIGTSRFLDLVDPTGKYSSINTFGSDGLLYRNDVDETFTFGFNDRNDIQSVIINQLEPLISSRAAIHFYYENFDRVSLDTVDILWSESTTTTNTTTGFFKNASGIPLAIGSYVSSNLQYLVVGSLIKFVPPAGYHFTKNNSLVVGLATLATDKTEIWASIIDVELDGTNFGVGELDTGIGPVSINNFVPSNAVPSEIILPYSTNLPTSLEQDMVEEIELLRDLGIGFDHYNNEWYLINTDNLDADGSFSLDYAQSTDNTNADASWLAKFEYTATGYLVTVRTLKYYFGSVQETRFFFDEHQKIYDSKTGKIVNDFIKILKTNATDDNTPLPSDIVLDIIAQDAESDGFTNDFNIEISYADLDYDYIVDDPDFFTTIVAPLVNPVEKLVFFQSTTDFDNLERYLPLTPGVVNIEYATVTAISEVKTEYSEGQLFYAYGEDKFYELQIIATIPTIVEHTDLISYVGRGDLQFQYRHNTTESHRINPGTSNIMDIYVVTSDYNTAYTQYINDVTGRVALPTPPTTDELMTRYNTLSSYGMTSDNIILNSVVFKPLFGSKAEESLQAYIKVVKIPGSTIGNSEIKSRMIAAINDYFDINHWDFGDTFYFSELSAYLHAKLGDIISTVVIIPKDTTQKFGNLYEIKSQPNEIFKSAATVNDIKIIDSLAASKIQIGN